MVFKCKMCGANLDVTAGMRICKCEYCDSVQTIPDLSSEKKLQLFNRANALRFACDFDRAGDVYRDIIADFPEEAEAYWGLCLCKYGIEYVVDPETQNRIPTCHRTSFEKIQDIPEFRKVLEYSDVNLRNIYSQLAEVIDGIQRNILEIAMKEKPFDVFICYKETAESGQRTTDALLAEKIYSVLTQQNIKVFFAPVTLKDKLGTEFEPYIYSAINSAQIMLCVGTSPEHFDSVWVRNEWSRFTELMKKDRSKILIPCYAKISVGKLPVEFRGFQAQDLTEADSLENIVKNVREIMSASEGAKSQLNVLMEQFEGQLRNERSKLRMLENVHHQQMIYEKQNAKKMFKKEYTPLSALAFLEIMIVGIVSCILTMLYATFDFDIMFVIIGVAVFSILPAVIFLPRINKRNKKARENLNRRLAYDETAPDFDYGSQDMETVQLREIAIKDYEKKHFSAGKTIGLYIGWSYFSFLPKSFIEGILGNDYDKFSSVFTAIFNVIIPVIALVLIIRRNIKLKKELNEKLDEINKQNKI
ncbi:MAG: toll/interleukin-1 receptor domain-containing protein [Ruminococcus sp.]|nr:toll/interleukin-1 receptor domain-containing protein [Ruminococcus sp.]